MHLLNYLKRIDSILHLSSLLLKIGTTVNYGEALHRLPVAKFIVPDWGDKVGSGIGVVVPARQATYRIPVQYDNLILESTISTIFGFRKLLWYLLPQIIFS
jgi:hypothetical protein